MKVLGLQHAEVEHPGYFRKLLEEDGHSYSCVDLNEGQLLPELDNFDALWVLGGPMDVWEEKKFPWLSVEKNFIKDAILKKGIPYLGLCLGHQLMAVALGGEVLKAKNPEIGVMDVHLTEKGASGVLFDGISETFKCLQWHSSEVTVVPEGTEVLASSEKCYVQAMKWGTRAYSFQFHLEVEDNTVESWSKIYEYKSALEKVKGIGGIKTLQQECIKEMPNLNRDAERVYMNWMQTSARV